ncbi:adenylylsulfate kinase [Gracilibacillus boraciitolerans JCM 21714]|uniref:Adenylyl-sulfate kinase n=1 Tax=Gracilibacillus boraciitolerans JCM 21714 TaxID=1298598 RepID=W4VFY9_9BACI|nr:adenylyl-sulfate kinase [Gracilibacillus boraciitolerans]GAE92071.1 adenylylsulfate kinase [Gracilibacillus boraciitolerans JCM 21714]
MTEANNIVWHASEITKQDRTSQNKHQSPVLWFTGLSGSGKSTITVALEKTLFERGIRSYRLDGDNIRHGLNNNLGFSPDDRKENIRRIGEVAKLLNDAGLITLTAFISPYREDRDKVRQLLPEGDFIEVYVKCSLEGCEARDPKGLYQKARSGEIKGFTGIDAPYEEPVAPELVIDTENNSVEAAVSEVLTFLEERKYI